jgi:hypothetical protein
LTIAGCGGRNGSTTLSSGSQGAVYVTGEDASLPSVVSPNLSINSITLTWTEQSATGVVAYHGRFRSPGWFARTTDVEKVREYSPERVAQWTGISASDIVTLAREYATPARR